MIKKNDSKQIIIFKNSNENDTRFCIKIIYYHIYIMQKKNKNLFLNKNEYYILNEYKQIGSNDLKGIGFDKKVVIFNDKLNTITKDLIENRATKSFSLKNKCLQKKILFFNKEYQSHFWRLNDMIHFLTYYELIKNKYNNYNNNFNNLNNPSLFQLYDNYIFNSNEKVSNYNLSNFKEIKTDNKIEHMEIYFIILLILIIKY